MAEPNYKYILTKISDDKFNGFHPNAKDEGYIKMGNNIYPETPTVGELFWVDNLHTSTVTKPLNEQGIFKTKNSTYKLEILEQ